VSAGPVTDVSAAPSPLPDGVYRANQARFVLVALALTFAGLFIYFASGITAGQAQPSTGSPGLAERAVYLLIATPFLLLAGWEWRAGLYVAAGGVTVRNVPSTARLPWTEIDCFAMGHYKGWLWLPIIGRITFRCTEVRCRDGRSIRIGVLNPNSMDNLPVDRIIERLNARVEQSR
jgi:hypothetical protein